MKTKNIIIPIFFLAGIFSLASCKDEFQESTVLGVNQAFSPTGLTAIVVNKTGVRLTWKAVKNADSYTVEIFENGTLDFSSTAVKTVEGIKFAEVPYTVNDLAGATAYSVRVKAVGLDIEDSKYVAVTFTTAAEQIFLPVTQSTIQATSVVLNWTPGQTATSITLAPGNIVRPITAAEITAGQATITGLTGETLYTAALLNGTKTRGTITFTTLLDLKGAISVSPTDNLVSIIAAATGGETFALLPGTYNINGDILVSKTISIQGAKSTDKPIINGGVIRIRANSGLSLKDMILNGTGALNDNQAIIFDEALDNAYGGLTVENCEIKNYIKGLMYVNNKTLIQSVTFKNNLIHSITSVGGDFIDFRQGLAKTFLFENNTVYNCVTNRDLFRMDAGGSTNFPQETSIITIRTNTFNNVITDNTKRYLYIRLASHQIIFTKNIIANSAGYYTNQTSTTLTTVANNNYFNSPNFTASAIAGSKNDTGVFTSLNPGFSNVSASNFTISNLDLKNNGIGDARWR
ncbi:DUF4957 domain-containing protein [Pedobacter alpinus]|uniref:DUF4957 domain-containing protein n=1 Tax=Pedobacter alpinus TaxID=1590643 RepID=A0ABW5TUE1_9SPHI